MIGGKLTKYKKRSLLYFAIATAIATAVLIAALVLMGTIEQKLRQGAEQQVVTFTEQAAANVSYRVSVIQRTIGAFTVQSSNPEDVVPALKNMTDRFDFSRAAFATPDGQGIDNDGAPFSIADLPLEETAISQGTISFSESYEHQGRQMRLAQSPKYIQGELVGALYVEIPLSMFAMPQSIDMFDGRGYFLLFQGTTEEVLTIPSEDTKTPIEEGMSFYSFLNNATGKKESTSNAAAESEEVNALRGAVTSGEQTLVEMNVDGKRSYVSVSPVGMGSWYVCNVIPVSNVRAETSVVLVTFQVVFGIVLVCFLMVVALLFSSYRKRMRARSVATKSRLYKAMSDGLDMAVNLYCPSDGSVTPIVAKSAYILGYSLPEIMADKKVAEELSFSENGRALLNDLREGNLRELTVGEFSFKHSHTEKVCWISYSVSSLMYEEKQRYLVVFQDVTREKELQLSMKEAMVAAEAANRAKSEFLSRMSHEIRTPMNAIIGMLQIAKLHTDSADRTEESLKKIGAASNHLLNLINDVLDISKIESGKMVLTNAPFRLSILISNVLEVIRPQCEQKKQSFEIEMPQEDHVFVGDIFRLKQMLINLLINAVKYTPERGHIRFTMIIAKDSIATYRRITFIISDDGIGMTEEFKEILFEPFVMEGRTSAQGTGLGMPIVKNAVTTMGGNICVETEVDKGTTFTIDINLRAALDAEIQELVAAEQADEAWEHSLDQARKPAANNGVELPTITHGTIFGTDKRIALSCE